jgi:hypothetical protein
MKTFALAVLLSLAAAFLLAPTIAHCGNERLTVVQDESSMEKTIAVYLRDTHSLVVEEKTAADDANDLSLDLPFKGEPMPKFHISIDSQPLNRSKSTKRVTERGILFNLFTGVMVPEGGRAAAQNAINDWNRRKAFASVYIDTDGQVVCCWVLNVLSEGLATEYVYDTVARLQDIWKGLWPLLPGGGPVEGGLRITDLHMAKSLDDNRPVGIADTFAPPLKVIHTTFNFQNAKVGTVFNSRLFLEDQELQTFRGAVTVQDLAAPRASFTFTFDNPAPPGQYKVQILSEEKLLGEISFKVTK